MSFFSPAFFAKRPHSAIASPDDISGLLVWYDATQLVFEDSGSTDPVEDADNVIRWGDVQGNAASLQGAGGIQPIYDADGLNSLPAVQMGGGANTRLITGTVSFTNTNSISVFFVARHANAGAADSWAINFIPNGGSEFTSGHFIFFRTGASIDLYVNGTTLDGSGIAYDTPFRLGFVDDNTNLKLYKDGALVDTDSSGPAYGANNLGGEINIGWHGDKEWVGRMSEVVMYNRALTTEEVADLDAYFVDKWGF
jgi:hypothetical protein